MFARHVMYNYAPFRKILLILKTFAHIPIKFLNF